MNRMNSCVDEIQDFVKTNIPTSTNNKKGKQVSFANQLPSQATINPRNQGSSSIQTHNLSHVHVDEEAVEAALAISSLRSSKDLPDPYKDHPLHKSSIDDETPTVVVEQDSSSDDEEEWVRAEPNLNTYKPPVPYPQVLNKPKAKVSESDDHLLEAFQKMTITIPLVDAIRHIPSYAKFLKGICTPFRSPKRIHYARGPSNCQPTCHVVPHTGAHVDARTRVASCHVSAPCAPPAPRVGHRWLFHMASALRRTRAVVLCATSAR